MSTGNEVLQHAEHQAILSFAFEVNNIMGGNENS